MDDCFDTTANYRGECVLKPSDLQRMSRENLDGGGIGGSGLRHDCLVDTELAGHMEQCDSHVVLEPPIA